MASSLPPDRPAPGRNRLAAALLDELLPALADFQERGFEPFHAAWREWDLLFGQPVELDLDSGRVVAGQACGVDPGGGLLLEQEGGGFQVFHSGEVRVRHG